MTAPATPTGVLDLGKPMRRKGCGPNISVLWYDAFGALVVYEDHSRAYLVMAVLTELFENMPPEPPKPVGYDEFDAWLASQMPQNTVIGDPHWWTPKIVRAAIRYLRADLPEDPPGSWSATDPIRSRLPRKVKPLTYSECRAIAYATSVDGVEDIFRDIMAARGIEVGE